MKKIMFLIFTSLLFTVLFTGCSQQANERMEVKEEKNLEAYDLSKLIHSNLSANDHNFIESLMSSLGAAKDKMDELEVAINEAEFHDEYDEAYMMMEQTKQEILFIWNQIHNHSRPEHPELQKLKLHYEDILQRYQQGIDTELQGMGEGDGIIMKEGYQTTETARADFQTLSREAQTHLKK